MAVKWFNSGAILKKVRKSRILPLREKSKSKKSTARVKLESMIHSMDCGQDIYHESGSNIAHITLNKPKLTEDHGFRARIERKFEFDKFRRSLGDKDQ
jgi:hypothetical protein